MKTQLIAALALISTLAFVPQSYARPNAGAPIPTTPALQQAPNIDEFMVSFQPRMERVKAMPAGEARDANIVSLLAELAAVLTPLSASIEIDAAGIVQRGVLDFVEGYRQLNTTARVLPPNHPAVLNLKAAMELLTHNLSDLDAASSKNSVMLAGLDSNLNSVKISVIARNQGKYLVGPAQTVFNAMTILSSGLSAFDSYEKACASQILNVKTSLFTSGTSPRADARVEQANTACILQKPQVDAFTFSQLQQQIQAASQGLRSHYSIVN